MEFEETYREYFHHVYRFLCSLTGNPDLSEELTQETFFKAMRALDRFDGKKDILAWLFTIARNTYYSYCRKKRRIADIPDTEIDMVSDDNLTDRIIVEETVTEINRFLHNMKEPYKEVFTLRVYGELSYRQIGLLFGKSEGWARVTYCRAKKMIIDYMEVNKND